MWPLHNQTSSITEQICPDLQDGHVKTHVTLRFDWAASSAPLPVHLLLERRRATRTGVRASGTK